MLFDHRVLICDRDRKWTAAVRQVLAESGIRIVQTPFHSASRFQKRDPCAFFGTPTILENGLRFAIDLPY